jgi:hypothetical protein
MSAARRRPAPPRPTVTKEKKMTRRLGPLAALLAALALLLAAAASAGAAEPAWQLDSNTNSVATPGGEVEYHLQLTNRGDAEADGTTGDPIVLTATLPPDVSAESVEVVTFSFGNLDWSLLPGWSCVGDGPGPAPAIEGAHHLTCQIADKIGPHGFTIAFGPAQPILTAKVAAGAAGVQVARFGLSGAGAAATQTAEATRISPVPAAFGVDSFDSRALAGASGASYATAAGHPFEYETDIDLNSATDPNPILGPLWPVAPAREIAVALPPGFVGNPIAAPTCSESELASSKDNSFEPLCPSASQVGTILLHVNGQTGSDLVGPLPLYNLVPPPGAPARFGFNYSGSVVTMQAHVRGGGDYGLTVSGEKIPEGIAFTGLAVDFWGVPASPAHRPERACPGGGAIEYAPNAGPECDGAEAQRPFLRMPTSCPQAGQGEATTVRVESWKPGVASDERTIHAHAAPGYPLPEADGTGRLWGAEEGVSGCAQVPFEPSISGAPTTTRADSPSGLSLDISIPQQACWEEEGGRCQSDLKDARVVFPAGLSVNPSSAAGQVGCSTAQIGLLGTAFPAPAPIRFTDAAPECPDASKIGTATVTTPLLHNQIQAGVYLAAQKENPFGSLLAIYVAGRDPASGVVLKLAGRIDLGPEGRLTATFTDQPQLPFSNFHFELFSGPRAALRTPSACGSYTAHASLAPWSGGAAAELAASFQVDQGCGGGFAPKLSAGTTEPLAGAYSPFDLRLTREDGDQELSSLTATLPKGLLARLAGVPYCPDSTLASISEAEGTGRAQIASPSCPAASLLGTVTVGAGAGPSPLYVSTGRAYLAGPYKGAPLSLAVVTPAVAGPFDLGTVVVRNALRVDPLTAQVTAVSDPLPRVLHGIPLDLRDIRIAIDRPGFTLNPTSCDPSALAASVAGTGGATAALSDRFQVGGCERLAFKPRLALTLKGGTRRTGHPALRAVLTYPAHGAYANIARAQVGLPRSEFLDQGNLNKTCTRPVLLEGACPASTVYGRAKAWTPLLAQPLQGPVYLVGGFGYKLPALVAELDGQIRVLLVGRIDTTKHHGIRSTFEVVPDAPVSRFELSMKGGKKYGLLENSENLCAKARSASARLIAQSGRQRDLSPRMRVSCKRRHVAKKHSAKPSEKRPGAR